MSSKVENLQNNLSLIRACAGLSAYALAKKLDVSRQMISNLEHGRNTMTMMQYLAIRQVLTEEIEQANAEEVEMLKDVIKVLVDEPEKYSEEDRERILYEANRIASSILAKETSLEKASKVWKASIAAAIIASAAGGIVAAAVAISKSKK